MPFPSRGLASVLDDDEIPGPPAWIKATALVVLLALVLPVAANVWVWCRQPPPITSLQESP